MWSVLHRPVVASTRNEPQHVDCYYTLHTSEIMHACWNVTWHGCWGLPCTGAYRNRTQRANDTTLSTVCQTKPVTAIQERQLLA